MMNEKTINEQYAYIRTLLEEKRLKEALMQLESLLWQCPDWDLRTRLEQLQTSYKYMLESIPKVGGGHMEYCRPVTPTHAGQRFIKILSRSTSYTRTGRFGRIWPKKNTSYT